MEFQRQHRNKYVVFLEKLHRTYVGYDEHNVMKRMCVKFGNTSCFCVLIRKIVMDKILICMVLTCNPTFLDIYHSLKGTISTLHFWKSCTVHRSVMMKECNTVLNAMKHMCLKFVMWNKKTAVRLYWIMGAVPISSSGAVKTCVNTISPHSQHAQG